jgi:hypothetical protein
MPAKNSIWRPREIYSIDRRSFSDLDFQAISRLLSVNAAKMNATPIPPRQLLEIALAVKNLPKPNTLNVNQLIKFLTLGLKHDGAGIPTLMCMLAVERKGMFPPMDRFFAAGLLVKRKVTECQFKQLNSKSPSVFSPVYVNNVIPAWTEAKKTRSNQAADDWFFDAGKNYYRRQRG